LRKTLILIFAALVLLLPMSAAQAITRGQPDNGAHPYVGQILNFVPDAADPRFPDPGGWFNCSATLLDPTHVLTAGHCTFGTGLDGKSTPTGSGGNDTWISFEEVPDYSILPPSSSFATNADRYAAWEAALDASPTWHRATAYSHPQYDDAAFFLHDLGVLVLDEPVEMDEYGQLPTLGLIDQLYKADKKATYTPVGYGLEESSRTTAVGGDNRRTATVQLLNTQGAYGAGKGIAVAWSSNNGKNHTGGTCFGDSGGPTFPEGDNTVLTVTSFGIDANCRAGGGGYRVDQADDLNWLATFGLRPAA
jgi:hypothetical protein